MVNDCKKWLVTGGEGLIGYHLSRKLLSDGNEVVTYDANKYFRSTGERFWLSYTNYRTEELDSAGATRVSGDVTNRNRLRATLEDHEPDVVVHLASLPFASAANERPMTAYRNITEATTTLLDVVRDVDFTPERVVYISSSMVYGDFNTTEDGTVVPATEEDRCDPKGLYGCQKLNCEALTRTYGRQFDIPYTIVRPSAVYGPTSCNGPVTELFLTNALRGERLRLDNGGEQKVDFTYVEDLAEGLALAAEHENAVNETFNLTRGEGRSICELAEVVSDLVPETEVYSVERDFDRPKRGSLDISKARELLGYEPTHSLEAGMASYLDFLESEGFVELEREQTTHLNF